MRPPVLDRLFAPVSTLPGVGPRTAPLFARLLDRSPDEAPVVDILFHLPHSGIDRHARPAIVGGVSRGRRLHRPRRLSLLRGRLYIGFPAQMSADDGQQPRLMIRDRKLKRFSSTGSEITAGHAGLTIDQARAAMLYFLENTKERENNAKSYFSREPCGIQEHMPRL